MKVEKLFQGIGAGNNAGGMMPLRQRVNKYGSDAKMTREAFEKYLSSEGGSVPWQLKHVSNCEEDFATATYKKRNL